MARGQAGEKNRETVKEGRGEGTGAQSNAGWDGFVGNFAYLRHRGWPRLILLPLCEKKESCRGYD